MMVKSVPVCIYSLLVLIYSMYFLDEVDKDREYA